MTTMWMRRCPLGRERARDRGFTLIELMVTLTVLAVLLAIATPSFKDFTAGQRAKAAAYDLATALVLARSEAVKRNTTVTLAPITADTWISGWTVKAGTTTLLQQEALSGVTIAKAASAASIPSSFVYGASGRLTSSASAQYLEVSASSSVKCVKIDLTGIPSTHSASCT